MARIRVDANALRHDAAKIEKRITDLQHLNEKLRRLLGSIDDSWEGKASEQYIQMMQRHLRKAEMMVEVLREFKKYVEEAATRFEHKDREGASRIRGC